MQNLKKIYIVWSYKVDFIVVVHLRLPAYCPLCGLLIKGLVL